MLSVEHEVNIRDSTRHTDSAANAVQIAVSLQGQITFCHIVFDTRTVQQSLSQGLAGMSALNFSLVQAVSRTHAISPEAYLLVTRVIAYQQSSLGFLRISSVPDDEDQKEKDADKRECNTRKPSSPLSPFQCMALLEPPKCSYPPHWKEGPAQDKPQQEGVKSGPLADLTGLYSTGSPLIT